MECRIFGRHRKWGLADIECHRYDRIKHHLHDLTTPEGSLVNTLYLWPVLKIHFGHLDWFSIGKKSHKLEMSGRNLISPNLVQTHSVPRFMIALTKVLRVRRNGLVWSGNPCNSQLGCIILPVLEETIYISNPTTSFTDCWTHLDLFVRETTSKLMDHPYTLSTQSKTNLNLLDGKVGLDILIFYKAEEPPWNIWRWVCGIGSRGQHSCC